MKNQIYRSLLLLCVIGLLTSLPIAASNLGESVQVHGFGGWAYGKTDQYHYMTGNPEGDYDNAEFSLNITAQPSERLSIVAQVHFDTSAVETSELEYAFADWTFSDKARLRMGRVKHPFGIYGEIPDVGTLRPFYFLPQSIYGPVGFTAKYYDGVGMTGRLEAGGGWRFLYDVYAGQIEGDFKQVGRDLVTHRSTFQTKDTIGLRLQVAPPITGLTFGFSAYQGDDELDAINTITADKEAWIVSLEYLWRGLTLRAEVASLEVNKFVSDGAYVEAAYRFGPHWELAGRWDKAEGIPYGGLAGFPSFFGKLLDHEDVGLGINYWFNPNFVIKASLHKVQGLYQATASAEELFGAFVTGELDDESELFTFGAQFSF